MPWQDRLQDGAYISPSGRRIPFSYENVSKNFNKKGTAFEFPDADGTFVQDLGRTGTRYPLRIIFWGNDYDLTANAFETILSERGIGTLEHPIYGTKKVVPLGPINRRDDLKDAANQAIFEITFFETILAVYPTGQIDPRSQITLSVSEFNAAMAEQFAGQSNLTSAVEQANAKGFFGTALDAAQSGLQAIADTQAAVQSAFDTIYDSINLGIDILIRDPLTLAFQTAAMLQAPARALASINDRLDAYRNLLDSIIGGNDSVASPGLDSTPINEFTIDDLFSSTYVSSSVLSNINVSFQTKTDAITAASELADQFADLIEWRDLNYESLGIIDTGEAYQKLLEAVSLTLGFLVDLSFDLRQERIITLDRPRTIVDLAAELYGSIDDRLDFLINSNSLTGDEILELPLGREIKYYV